MTTRSKPRPSGKPSSRIAPHLKKAAKTLGKRLTPRSRRGKRAMAIGLGVIAVLTLTIGLVAESALSYTVSTMGALGAVAVRRAEVWQAQYEQEKRASRTPRPAASPPPKPAQGGEAPPPPSGGQVRCTETGKPADSCGCATRHVATAEGAARYGRPVGSPIGRRARAPKPAGTTKPGLAR